MRHASMITCNKKLALIFFMSKAQKFSSEDSYGKKLSLSHLHIQKMDQHEMWQDNDNTNSIFFFLQNIFDQKTKHHLNYLNKFQTTWFTTHPEALNTNPTYQTPHASFQVLDVDTTTFLSPSPHLKSITLVLFLRSLSNV